MSEMFQERVVKIKVIGVGGAGNNVGHLVKMVDKNSITPDKKVAEENKSELVSGRANVLAVRENDYNNDEKYKTKIDVLTEALLSKEAKKHQQGFSEVDKKKYKGIVYKRRIKSTYIDAYNYLTDVRLYA